MARLGVARFHGGMDERGEHAESPVAAMTARVAALWRAQGEDFLDEYHEGTAADVDRLRRALVVAPQLPGREGERVLERLRRLDQAAVDRIAASRRSAVIDLTGEEPVVRVESEEDGREDGRAAEPAWHECRRCRQYVAPELMVGDAGGKVRPLCLDCALIYSGIRRAR
jgi:hypothetical protein